MNRPPLRRLLPRLLLAGLGGALAIGALLVLSADYWVRPLVAASLSRSSGREVRIDELRIRLARNLAPTILLRGVKVQNTAWAADARPMASAREVSFVFDSLGTLLHDQSLVSLVVMRDADIDLERQADGLRNWRLHKPDYRGPGKYLIQRVEAHNSRLRVVHRGIGLDVTITSSPATGELPNRLRFSGDYAGSRFSGELATSAVFSLQATQELFPVRGEASSASTRLTLDGRMADFLKLGRIDAHINISGPSLSNLHPFIRGRPPASHPYEAQGHLNITGDSYGFDHFTGKLGATDVAGFLELSRHGRRVWHAGLKSARAQLADLTSLSFTVDPANPNGSVLPAPAVNPAAAAGRILPARRLAAERLQYADAHVRVDLEKLDSPQWPALQSLHATADVKNGVLRVAGLDVGLAGGHATGEVTLDGQHHPPLGGATLNLRDLQPDRLVPRLRATGGATAPLSARIQLQGQGETMAAMLADANGKVSVSMAPGRISNLLDAMLDLDGGKLVWLKLTGDHDIALNCAALNLDFKNGIGRSSELLLDTAQTRAGGSATINLRDEHFDLLLTPQSKQGRLFALGSAIRASGSFRRAQYSIAHDGPHAAPIAACPAPSAASAFG